MSVTRNILFTLFATVLLYNCTAEEDDRPGPENGGVAVVLGTVSIGSEEPATRASADETLADGSTVRIVAYTNASMSAATYAGEGCYVMEGGALKPCTTDADGNVLSKGGSTDGLWLRSGASYHFFAVTPAVAVDHTQTPPVTKVKNRADFASSLTSGTGGAGIAIPKGAASVSGVMLNTLQRRCAHLSFAFDRVWTNVERVEIGSVKLTQMTNEPQQVTGTGDLPTNASHISPLVIGQYYFKTNATTLWLASGGAAVLPKASGGLDLTLSVRFNGSTTSKEFAATGIPALTFKKGMNYTFRVKLRDGVVILTLTTEPWTSHSSDTEAGTPPVDTGSDPWDGSEDNTEAGTPPVEVVIGSWTEVVWSGNAGHSTIVSVSGWQPVVWDGNVGGSGETGFSDWTQCEHTGDVGG